MHYDFDHAVNRKNTYSMKYDDEFYFRQFMPDLRLDDDTIRILLADMDFQCAPAITKAMHRVADFGTFGYTTDKASPDYFDSIIRWYKKRYNFDIKREWVIHSNGALDGVGRTIEAFSEPGDGVIICGPVYSNFTSTTKRLKRKIVNCQMVQPSLGDYRMDWEKFESLCAQPENKVYILCSPQNPVGRVWEKEELQRMAAICKKNGVVLVSDEIHSDIIRKGVHHWPILQAVEDWSNLVMVSGVNKTFNLMALECAYSIVPDDALRKQFLDGYNTGVLSPFAVAAVIAAYDESEDWLNELNAYLDESLTETVAYIQEKLPKAKVYMPQGTYILWVDFSDYGFSPETLQTLTNKVANVAVQGGMAHDPEQGRTYLRICLTSPKAIVKEAIDRMSKAYTDYENEHA